MSSTERLILYGIVAAVVIYFIDAYTSEATAAAQAQASASAAASDSIAGQASSIIDDFGGFLF